MAGFNLLHGACHWVRQKQPEHMSKLLVEFMPDYANR
jgi:hypothetical protein